MNARIHSNVKVSICNPIKSSYFYRLQHSENLSSRNTLQLNCCNAASKFILINKGMRQQMYNTGSVFGLLGCFVLFVCFFGCFWGGVVFVFFVCLLVGLLGGVVWLGFFFFFFC